MGYFYLDVIKGNESGRKYLLTEGALTIGRQPSNNILLPSTEKSVSGHHAILYRNGDEFIIQDMQSTNGTFVNDQQVTQQNLELNDVIGLGKNGPRLQLIYSEKELSTDAATLNNSLSATATSMKTKQDDLEMIARDFTNSEDNETITKLRERSFLSDSDEQPSITMEMERKLINKDYESKDLQDLMSDSKRLEKIIDRGNLGQTQSNMLKAMHTTTKKMNRKWVYIVSVVAAVSVLVSSFFAIRSIQYKRIVDQAKSLREEMQGVETQIAKANTNPGANETELKKLIAELEKKQAEMSSLKTKIDDDDFGKFYSDPLEKKIDDILLRLGENNYHIPSEMVDRVRFHLEIYTSKLRPTVGRYLARKEKYFPMINQIFREKNIPLELSYVSMLESGFNPLALSHAGARGLWQFMPATGVRYGLRVDEGIDERTDPEKATYAAAEYFKDLIGIFGGKSSVMLCMAAYNAGEGRVMGALRKIDDPMRNRDFWYIYRMGYLAEETNEYIPRVISFIIISENPEEYGFASNAIPKNIVESESDFIEKAALKDLTKQSSFSGSTEKINFFE